MRYYTAAAVYCMIYAAVFYLLTVSPVLVGALAQIFKFNADAIVKAEAEQAVTIALVVGTVLPKAPLIREVDSALRQYLQDRALIGYHALSLGQDLVAAPFDVPSELNAEVRSVLRSQGVQEQEISSNTEDEARDLWVKIVSITKSLGGLNEVPGLAAFKQSRQIEFSEIAGRYGRLEEMASTLFTHLRPALEADEPKIVRLVATYEKSFTKEAQGLWRSMCLLVSQAALSRALTVHRRKRFVNSLGFHSELRRDSTADFVAAIFVALFAATIAVNVLLSPEAPLWSVIKRGFVVVCSGVVSIIFAWLIRVSWGSPHRPGHLRPILSYLLAGCAATAVFIPIRTLLRAWMEGMTVVQMLDKLGLTEWPFLLLTFAASAGLAYCLDNTGESRVRRHWLSLVEALSLALLLAAVAGVVGLLRPAGGDYYAQNWTMIVVSAVHGLMMGTFVPAWRRSETRKERERNRRRYELADPEPA
jgi:hypothetical protein